MCGWGDPFTTRVCYQEDHAECCAVEFRINNWLCQKECLSFRSTQTKIFYDIFYMRYLFEEK